jgi:hypothetical protein
MEAFPVMKRVVAPLLAASAIILATEGAALSALAPVGGVLNVAPPVQTEQQVVIVPSPSFTESAVASCAGGAMIGYLLVAASGAGAPVATSALFCGMSVAASATGSITAWLWHRVTAPFN